MVQADKGEKHSIMQTQGMKQMFDITIICIAHVFAVS